MDDSPAATDITRLLARAGEGDRDAMTALAPLVYAHLRRLARRQLAGEQARTLSTTALVHEAWLNLAEGGGSAWRDRDHFYRYAATAMRHILVDHARARQAAKRGGDRIHLDAGALQLGSDETAASLVAVDQALAALATINPRLAQVVELRFFAGLEVEDTARVLGVHARSVVRDWRKARAILNQLLGEGDRDAVL
jgi:RNA polymerase sigma factor (TIGR02999 family)